MTDSVLTTEHLAQLVDRCITDLQNKSPRMLSELGTLLHSLAQATGDETYRVLSNPIGAFGNELASFQPLVVLPLLPTETRDKCHGMFEQAIKEGVEALGIVKSELQKGQTKDYKELVRAIALLTENDYKLYAERSGLTRTSSRPMPESD